MRKFVISLSVFLILTLLMPVVKAEENRALWSMSTYIQSAKIIYQHEYRKDKARPTLYKAIDLLREASVRYQHVPEIYFTLGTFFAEINELDTMIAYFDSTQIYCGDESVEEKYRKKCKKDKYDKKIDGFRQKYWEEAYNEAVEFLRQYDTVTVMIENAPSEDSAAVLGEKKKLAFELTERGFMQAILVKPKDAMAYTGYGLALEREGRLIDAIVQYRKAMELTGENDADVSKIAYAYISSKPAQWDSSIVWFEKLLEYQPENTSAIVNLSICYNSIGDYDKAQEYVLRDLEIEPENASMQFTAGQYWYRKMLDINTEISDIEDTTAESVALAKELDVKRIGTAEKAEGFFKKAHEVDPNDLNTIRQLGVLYLISLKNIEAAETFEKYVAIEPNDVDILDYLGRTYIQLGEFEKAIPVYEKTDEIKHDDVDVLERLEELYRHIGNTTKADETKVRIEKLNKL
ncbi:MAG: tetratricopeptide repeat protein [FCB group bacterium]|nr:tetratricopeptide repeat protein [FCB group bacterium]